jgi:homoserine kinase
MIKSKPHSYEVRVPASSANLGAGFDCFGLALNLYLTVRATVRSEPGARSEARSRGIPGSEALPSAPEENLILRAMQHAAERHGQQLPPVHLAVQNQIPIAGGLGGSAAAIVAGIVLGSAVCGKKPTVDNALRLAAEMEQHTDNVGAALLGGLVVSFVDGGGNVVALRKKWPQQIKVVAVTPKMMLQTAASRAALPQAIEHAAAVHNLQRSALFLAALDDRRDDLLWEAMQDRLHQSYRQALIPGLAEVLAIPRMPGLLGVALSGAGPTVIALATKNFAQIGKALAGQFAQRGLTSSIQNLTVAHEGIRLNGKPLAKKQAKRVI